MTERHHDGPATPPEQIIYANLLLIGVWVGLFLLMLTLSALTMRITRRESVEY